MIPRLRALFPPEVTGLVVSMVGIELIVVGAPRFMGYAPASGAEGAGTIDARAVAVAAITLGAMIAPTVWGRGRLRLYTVLVGLAVGYAASLASGAIALAELRRSMAVPLVALPERAASGLAFDVALLVPFLIAGLTSTL